MPCRVRLLLEAGLSVSALDHKAYTALHLGERKMIRKGFFSPAQVDRPPPDFTPLQLYDG